MNSENTEQNNKNPGDLIERKQNNSQKYNQSTQQFNDNNQQQKNQDSDNYYSNQEYQNQDNKSSSYFNIFQQQDQKNQNNSITEESNINQKQKDLQKKFHDVISSNPGLLDYYHRCNQGFWASLAYVGAMTFLLQGVPAPVLQELVGRALTVSSLLGFYLLPKTVVQQPETGFPMIEATIGRTVLYTLGNFGVAMTIAPKIQLLENIVILENIGISILLWKLAQVMVLKLKVDSAQLQNTICLGGMMAILTRGEGMLESMTLFFLANYVANTQTVNDYFTANPDNLQMSLLMVFIVQCYFLTLTMAYYQQLNEDEKQEIENSLEQHDEEHRKKAKTQKQIKKEEIQQNIRESNNRNLIEKDQEENKNENKDKKN